MGRHMLMNEDGQNDDRESEHHVDHKFRKWTNTRYWKHNLLGNLESDFMPKAGVTNLDTGKGHGKPPRRPTTTPPERK
mgnify:CR=1 FL=1